MSDEKKIIALVLVAYFLSDEVGFSLFFLFFLSSTYAGHLLSISSCGTVELHKHN